MAAFVSDGFGGTKDWVVGFLDVEVARLKGSKTYTVAATHEMFCRTFIHYLIQEIIRFSILLAYLTRITALADAIVSLMRRS